MFKQSNIVRLLTNLIKSTCTSEASFRPLHTTPVPLYDGFHRKHDYLRISLIERCNLRCKYCMPEEGITVSKRSECLDLAELKRLTNIFVKLHGINKIRLTGGEPTIDKRLIEYLDHLNELRTSGLKVVAMTTNGLTLKRNSKLYKDRGLNAINVSLDTLKADKFELMTRRKGWHLVFQGLMAAIETKFDSIKLNCVIIKGFNDDEILDFVELARKYSINVRFIEFMPFLGNSWANNKMVSYRQMLDLVIGEYPNLKQCTPEPNEVAKVFKDSSMIGSIGFISSMSDNFCSSCNRVRLTADGNLKVCLFGRSETSLRDLMRNGASDAEIVKAIVSTLNRKEKQHAGISTLQQQVLRPMVKIAVRNHHSSVDSNEDPKSSFSHLNSKGEAKMVDVGHKLKCKRTARAEGRILVGSDLLGQLMDATKFEWKKGDIISVSRVAGIMGAKLTSQLIPMCHQIALDYVRVDINPCEKSGSLIVTAQVETNHRTGVEMECLTAVSVTLLTLYDMCKSANKCMVISDIKLVSKTKK